MSAKYHYNKAEELLVQYINLNAGRQILEGPLMLAEAQVHATLAAADASRPDSKSVRYAGIGANADG